MVYWLLLSALAKVSDRLPVSFIPMSQLPFAKDEYVTESKSDEKLGIVLATDDRIPHQALEAISKYSRAFEVVKLAKLDSSGKVQSWDSSGKALNENTEAYSPQLLDIIRGGNLAFLTNRNGFMTIPETATSEPEFEFHFAKPRQTIFFDGPNADWVFNLGPQTAKFVNIRMSFKVMLYVGSIPVKAGSKETIEGTSVSVDEIPEQPTNGGARLVVSQNQLPGAGYLTLHPVFDWAAIKAAGLKIVPESVEFDYRMIRAQGRPTPGAMRFNLTANVPLKYWKGITLIRYADVAGYLSHVPASL